MVFTIFQKSSVETTDQFTFTECETAQKASKQTGRLLQRCQQFYVSKLKDHN